MHARGEITKCIRVASGDASRNRRRALMATVSQLDGRTDCSGRDLYTFGVYTGASLRFWLERLAQLKIEHGPMWGFDSFEGLPEEAEGVELEGNEWKPGGVPLPPHRLAHSALPHGHPTQAS